MYMCAQFLSRVRLFETLWTVARQAPLSWDFPGKDTRVRCHFLLQGIFPSQGSNPHLPSSPALQSESLPLSQLVKSNLFSSEKGNPSERWWLPATPSARWLTDILLWSLPLLSHGLHPMCLSEKTQCWTVVTIVKTRVYPEMIAMGKRNLILELGLL